MRNKTLYVHPYKWGWDKDDWAMYAIYDHPEGINSHVGIGEPIWYVTDHLDNNPDKAFNDVKSMLEALGYTLVPLDCEIERTGSRSDYYGEVWSPEQ